MKNIMIGALGVILMLCAGCRTLEFALVNAPNVVPMSNEAGPFLRISGSCSPSHVVESVTQVKKGRVVTVRIRTSPFSRDGFYNTFSTDVYVDDFDFVLFGDKQELIWRRVPGTVPEKARKPIFVIEHEEE